jgi:hypothetical protein
MHNIFHHLWMLKMAHHHHIDVDTFIFGQSKPTMMR